MSFKCQRCKQTLRIDDSLTNLDQASSDMLIAPLISEEQHEKQTQKARIKRTLKQPPQPIDGRLVGIKPIPTLKKENFPPPSESFVVLPRPELTVSLNNNNNNQISLDDVSNNTSNQLNTTSLETTHNANLVTGSQVTPTVSTSAPIEDPNWSRNNTLSHRLKVANRVFQIMSSKSSVDHPMCQECTDILLETLERQMSDVSRERDCYIEFLKKVKEGRVTKEEEEELKNQVEELKLAEKEASEELMKLKEEEARYDKELKALESELKELDQQEEEFWEKANEYQTNLQHFQNERDSINLKYDHDVKQYERLQKTVVYNDAFCISQDGPFGTINGFRLGRTSTYPVEWNEINAAWGQTLLLLYTIANKLKFQFKTYRLVPMGSFSRIEKVDGDSVISYELYGSGDFGINKMFFLNRRFDHAMVAVLNCLKQLTDYAEARDKTIRLPYRINKDKIGDLSIRIQFNQDDLWTKALRYMLINMKWILAFSSRANNIIIPNESPADSSVLI
ncbi:autophagy protein Apg6-domain-containing protein [Cokeromyces recurvatus]|uniref:autophagy protein Apg6-domain-containing protein n=1 Tax=Cokeromyces recurvatus TaxID=90255 RepID=UPI002220009A|nr:autophagy protein Apg6-domain-containing protein [Cokeromyces recurvatus]KAI7905922.1 autophagy protein Apg6-domain-containing protein [Cokeromyces recurvatus]